MRKISAAVLPFICASALTAYYYAVSTDFRFLFLDEGGAVIIRGLRNPLETDILIFFLFSAGLMYAGGRILSRLGVPVRALSWFCIPALFCFSFLPQAISFPELIPVAAVILPAAALSAFAASLFKFPPGKKSASPLPSVPGLDRRAAAVFALSFVIFFASGYHINETTGYHSGDEGHYLTMARSIAEDFDLDIRNQIPGYTPAMRAHVHISPHSPEGYGYSWHPPGLSFLFAPFFRLYDTGARGLRGALFSLYLLGAFLTAQIYLAARDYSGSKNIGMFSAAVLMLSSPMWIYSIRAYPMMPGGLCILYCWRKLRGVSASALPGFILFNLALAWLAWLHDTLLPAYGIMGVTLFIFWLKDVRNKKLLITLLVQALNIAVFVHFRFSWYGSNFFGQHGGLFNFWPGLFGAWFDFFRGMIFASPVHFLAFILLLGYVFRKRDLYSIILLLLYASVYIPGSSSTVHWTGGSSHPGRRLAPCIPLAAVPLAYFIAEKRKYSFYWLAGFLGIISIGFMSYFILFNPYGFTRPLSSIVLAEQLFRPLDFHLPAFGTSFRNFPWGHFYFALANISGFTLFWILLAGRERKPDVRYMSAGMTATVLWIFLSVGVMKTFFDSTPPAGRTPELNFRGNTMKLAEPAEDQKVFFYTLEKPPERVSFGLSMEGLPRHLELSRGLYELKIKGRATPSARAGADVLYVREGIRLAKFVLSADEDGSFNLLKYLYMPGEAGAARIILEPEAGAAFSVKKTGITPVPGWLVSLRRHIEKTDRHYGLFKYAPLPPPQDEYAEIPSEGFILSASGWEDILGNMTDGNPSTRWTTHEAQAPGQYFEVDMGQEYLISGIRLDQGKFWRDWPRGLEIHASADGIRWQKVYADDGFGGYVYPDKDDPCFRNMENCVRVFFEPLNARRLRVEQTGKERIFWWSVAGFSVLVRP